jgi:chromosome partitioning protein
MAANVTTVQKFEELFEKPSIDGMLSLDWVSFQSFVQYVFECAGYVVEYVGDRKYPFGPGVDFNLHVGKMSATPIARVEVRHYAPTSIMGFGDVAAFLGVLDLGGNVPGYLVTTSDFAGPAQAAAQAAAGRVRLVNGQRLVRYIRYIGASRLDRVYSGGKLPLSLPTEPDWLATADALMKSVAGPPARARILAVGNNKGGVGKTTTARYLGQELVKHQQRVLVVDLDAQTNLTECYFEEGWQDTIANHLGRYFAGQCTLADTVQSIDAYPGLSICPSHPHLSRMDSGGSAHPDAELKFVGDLYEVAAAQTDTGSGLRFDWILLDTPPAISLFTRTALAAADDVLIPARARGSSLSGAKQMLLARRAMDALMGRADAIIGCLITHWAHDQTSLAGKQRLADVFAGEGVPMLDVKIPLATAIETQPQYAYQAVQAYTLLAEEVLQYVSSK